MAGAAGPQISVGQTLRIPEAHYLYGVGELALRVTDVDPDLARYSSLEWAGVRGIEVRRDGKDGDQRHVMVRVAWLNANARQQ
jgi:hypothetical protein